MNDLALIHYLKGLQEEIEGEIEEVDEDDGYADYIKGLERAIEIIGDAIKDIEENP